MKDTSVWQRDQSVEEQQSVVAMYCTRKASKPVAS